MSLVFRIHIAFSMSLRPLLPSATPILQLQWNEVEDANLPDLTRDQLFALQIASLVTSSVSFTCLLVASYWFFRMRRTFRHEYSSPITVTWILLIV